MTAGFRRSNSNHTTPDGFAVRCFLRSVDAVPRVDRSALSVAAFSGRRFSADFSQLGPKIDTTGTTTGTPVMSKSPATAARSEFALMVDKPTGPIAVGIAPAGTSVTTRSAHPLLQPSREHCRWVTHLGTSRARSWTQPDRNALPHRRGRCGVRCVGIGRGASPIHVDGRRRMVAAGASGSTSSRGGSFPAGVPRIRRGNGESGPPLAQRTATFDSLRRSPSATDSLSAPPSSATM